MKDVTVVHNFIGGTFLAPSTGEYLDVTAPHTGEVVAKVALSNAADINIAVAKAKEAFPKWSGLTINARSKIMFKLHHLVNQHAEELAKLVVLENGKTFTEAMGSVAKANETTAWACGLPEISAGRIQQVSRGVWCQDQTDPLGVVASVCPFNFPIMVPFWTTPIALTMGNCVIVKPSEKTPLTMHFVCELMKEAGIPEGVFQTINGAVDAVTGLCDHPGISALSFVGSSKVAEIVYRRCTSLNKRVLALGGAKNHLVALPDADVDMTAGDITSSFAGCAGQRCMAASVLLLVGENKKLLDAVKEKAGAMTCGTDRGQMGAVIDALAEDRVLSYIKEAEENGAEIVLDGRSWSKKDDEGTQGFFVGPTIILHKNKNDRALHDEIFGPVLSVLVVDTWEEAMEIENSNPYGNAACIYTAQGGAAEWFSQRFRAGMIGVNIGIPVPREPFTFAGMYGTLSRFGDFDVTGEGAMRFFSTTRKITTKWGKFGETAGQKVDHAQFR